MEITINGKKQDVKGLGWIGALIGLGIIGIILLVIGIIVFVILIPVFLAILGIWALNVLFHLNIAYNAIDILAGVVIILIIGGGRIISIG